MTQSTFDGSDTKYPRGVLIIEGKTKQVFQINNHPGLNNPHLVEVVSKDDITAQDGKKRDIILNKGNLSNATTCNTFQLLNECGVPLAFVEQKSSNSFIAVNCNMIPVEMVARREAKGSYLHRNPHIHDGHLFSKLKLEYFLKTTGGVWKGYQLPCDDPLMIRNANGTIDLYIPHFNEEQKAIYDETGQNNFLVGQKPFLTLPESEVFSGDELKLFPEMEKITAQTFRILEKAWQLEGRTLLDFKLEFGIAPNGDLLLADVIDPDSWRLRGKGGERLDKDGYRGGEALNEVSKKYRLAAELTNRFHLPEQQIILWRGSKDDDVSDIEKMITNYDVTLSLVTCSVHEQPVLAVHLIQYLVNKMPDSVVIAYAGMSNGAGPILSAATSVPVITIPADFVVNSKNAVLAAMKILAMRNPAIYATLQEKLEKRLLNFLILP